VAKTKSDKAVVAALVSNGLYVAAATATLAAVGLAVTYFMVEP